jgi:hypothetical protein
MTAKGKDRCSGKAAVFLKSDGHVGGLVVVIKVYQRAKYFCDGHHIFRFSAQRREVRQSN